MCGPACVFVVRFAVVKENQLHTQFAADLSRRELANGRGGKWGVFMCALCLGEGQHQPRHLLKLMLYVTNS